MRAGFSLVVVAGTPYYIVSSGGCCGRCRSRPHPRACPMQHASEQHREEAATGGPGVLLADAWPVTQGDSVSGAGQCAMVWPGGEFVVLLPPWQPDSGSELQVGQHPLSPSASPSLQR